MVILDLLMKWQVGEKVAVKEPQPQFIFKTQNLFAQRWLGNTQLIRCLRKVQGLGQGYCVLQLSGIQKTSSFLRGYRKYIY